uniref:H15 domain-containing protein n=2 Tax=Aegilops tauschii subsp. strangulata TaxID=200361 RepID=A0A452YGZ8_AEGTS
SPHPTYTKMITEALTELGGTSSRDAIAGFILGRFTNLPTVHDALLSAHLRRLVSEGVVCSFASTYILPAPARPRKDSLTVSATKNSLDLDLDPSRGLHASNNDDNSSSDDDDDDYSCDDDDDEYTPARAAYMLGTKCGRGRVSRAAPPVSTLDSSMTKRGCGRWRKEQEATSRSIKHGPSRPRKDASPFHASASATKPKKLLDLNLDPSEGLQIRSDDDEDDYSGDGGDDDGDVDYTPMLGEKCGRGRPRKRGRGRPRKVVLSTNGGGASFPLTKRGRGRLRKRQNACRSEASFQNGGNTMPMETPKGDFLTPNRGRGSPTKET